MKTAEQQKALSMRIIDILPDDPREAVASMAIAYAAVVASTNAGEDAAIAAFRVAMCQMRGGRTGKLDG